MASDLDGHIRNIGRALWLKEGRSGGRAAVFIGAGFSRNALKRTTSARNFPLWYDLALQLVDGLEAPCVGCSCLTATPVKGCLKATRRRRVFDAAQGTSGALRLGQMYEAVYGRARLEGILSKSVPNLEYDPGEAHQQLVRLPWADVFTTNWDTLLERAVDSYDRSYAIVNQPTQITVSPGPRIVKLHGSLDAGTRLIFTENDFRTYEREYSPYVSLVQQSLMENIFVLIGFSGEDPNFLAWHGWARDRLGDYLQHVYLITQGEMDPAERTLLLSRRVNPLEIRDLEGADYAAKINTFFKRLRSLKEDLRRPMRWPTASAPALHTDSDGLRLLQLMAEHPGWLVVPVERRSRLVARIDSYLRDLPARENGEPILEPSSPLTIALLVREIARGLLASLARPGARLLDVYKTAFITALASALPAEAAEAGFTQSELSRVMSEQAISPEWWEKLSRLIGLSPDTPTKISNLSPAIELLEREARVSGRSHEAANLRSLLGSIPGDGEHRQLQQYATALDHVQNLRVNDAQSVLWNWVPAANDPVWQLRKSGLLDELRAVLAAEGEAHAAVDLLRKLATQRGQGIWDASREAWAFRHYRVLLADNPVDLGPSVRARMGTLDISEVIDELDDRLRELQGRDCDPQAELEDLGWRLTVESLSRDTQRKSASWVLEPKQVDRSDLVVNDGATAFVVLQESVGLPLRESRHKALRAAALLSADAPVFARSLLFRVGRLQDVRDAWSYLEPIAFPHALSGAADWPAQRMFNLLDSAAVQPAPSPNKLPQTVSPLPSKAFVEEKINFILGLHAMRAEAGDRDAISNALNVAIRAHDHATLALLPGIWLSLRLFFQGLLSALIALCEDPAHDTFLIEATSNLLKLRLPTSFHGGDTTQWPDPFWWLQGGARANERGARFAELVRRAIDAASKDRKEEFALRLELFRSRIASSEEDGRQAALRRRADWLSTVLA